MCSWGIAIWVSELGRGRELRLAAWDGALLCGAGEGAAGARARAPCPS